MWGWKCRRWCLQHGNRRKWTWWRVSNRWIKGKKTKKRQSGVSHVKQKTSKLKEKREPDERLLRVRDHIVKKYET